MEEAPLLNTRDGQLLPSDPQEFQNNNDDLYWENNEIVIPTQVISDLSIEEDSSYIDEGPQTTTIPSKKLISRNVSNSQRRRFR